MRIPEAYDANSTFRKKLEDWACWSLRQHGFSCKDAPDIVQEVYKKVDEEPEPAEPINKWAKFLYAYLAYELLAYSRKEKKKSPAGSVSIEDPRGESQTLEEILVDGRPNPEEELIDAEVEQEWESRGNALPFLVKAAIAELKAEGKITGAERVECFSEVAMRYIKNAAIKFDTHRQAVEKECKDTPPKATAARWWQMVVERIPSLYEVLKAKIDGGYIS